MGLIFLSSYPYLNLLCVYWVSKKIRTDDEKAAAPWNKSPYGPIAPPTPGPNASMVLPTRSVATNNPYATLETMDEDADRDTTRTE